MTGKSKNLLTALLVFCICWNPEEEDSNASEGMDGLTRKPLLSGSSSSRKPPGPAVNHAVMFVDNRIQKSMLLDLNKEIMNELGVTVVGDIIAILKHAKVVHCQDMCKAATESVPCSPSPLQGSQAMEECGSFLLFPLEMGSYCVALLIDPEEEEATDPGVEETPFCSLAKGLGCMLSIDETPHLYAQALPQASSKPQKLGRHISKVCPDPLCHDYWNTGSSAALCSTLPHGDTIPGSFGLLIDSLYITQQLVGNMKLEMIRIRNCTGRHVSEIPA
ncbi:hypothetical protein STEG23_019705, partial [Scotinomys teguina]